MNIISIKTFVTIVIIYLIIIWITIIVWVIKDINSRTESTILQTISILITILFWPLWALVYLLVRPTTTFYQKYYEEVEWNIDYLTNAILKRLEEKEQKKEKQIIKVKTKSKKTKKKN